MAQSPTLIQFARIDSTSAFLRREVSAAHLSGPTVVVAQTQSHGSGRWSRAWVSPPGGLWMSLALPFPKSDAGQLLRGLGLRLGLAMWEGVATVLGPNDRVRLGLKWPNDLVILDPGAPPARRAKVAGLLAETVFPGSTPGAMWLIVGVGVNANVDPADLPDFGRGSVPARIEHAAGSVGSGLPATSLQAAFARNVNLDELRQSLTDRLIARATERGLPPGTLDAVLSVLVGMGERARFTLADDSSVEGWLDGIDPSDGLAIVRTVDGRVLRCAPQSITTSE